MFGGNIVEGRFGAQVHFGVVKEGAGYFLDETFSVFVKERGDVHSGWMLICRGAMYWFIPLVRVMPGLGGRYMLEFLEGTVYVVVY